MNHHRRQSMGKKKRTSSFSLTLINMYTRKGDQPWAPDFTYTPDKGEPRKQCFFEQQVDDTKAVRRNLHKFQPLSRKRLEQQSDNSLVNRPLCEVLGRELKKIWWLKAPAGAETYFSGLPSETVARSNGKDKKIYFLPLRLSRVYAICPDEDSLMLSVEVQPGVHGLDDEQLGVYGRILCDRLHRKKGPTLILQRSSPEAKASVERRFRDNNESSLILGIQGKPVTLLEIFDTLAGKDWQSVLGDSFLVNSLLITVNKEEERITDRDVANLVRLARGQNDNYLPPPISALAGYVIPIQTFANVLFMAAAEGVACHVKAGPSQDFLWDEFRKRYEISYFFLFTLVVYQYYKLSDLAGELDACVEAARNSAAGKGQDSFDRLRSMRKKLAEYEIQYINTQPSYLTNYQQFYSGLQEAFHIVPLVEQLRHDTGELDYLLAEQARQEQENKEEKVHNAKIFLAMVAECFALPYYLFHLLKEAVHLNKLHEYLPLLVTIFVTVTVLGVTWLVMHGTNKDDVFSQFVRDGKIFFAKIASSWFFLLANTRKLIKK